MNSRTWWAFLIFEVISTGAAIAFLVTAAITLKASVRTFHSVCKRGEIEPIVWARNTVRGRFAFVVVELIIVAMGWDRLGMMLDGYVPDLWCRWIAYGAGRLFIGLLVAVIAWANMRAYERLKDDRE
jgi:uncharacterized membrane protein